MRGGWFVKTRHRSRRSGTLPLALRRLTIWLLVGTGFLAVALLLTLAMPVETCRTVTDSPD